MFYAHGNYSSNRFEHIPSFLLQKVEKKLNVQIIVSQNVSLSSNSIRGGFLKGASLNSILIKKQILHMPPYTLIIHTLILTV